MRGLERFNRKMALNGHTLRDEHIKNSRALFENTFFDDPSFIPGLFMWQRGISNYTKMESLPIRIYNRKYSSANGVNMQFQSLHDYPVYTGDIIYDSNSGEYLLCTESFDLDHVNWRGRLTLCNWILKWQSASGEILEYPCHDMNSTQYNSGEEPYKQFTIGTSQHMLYLPADENTIAIKTPQRFFLDRNMATPTVFKVTQNDTTGYYFGPKGIVVVTLLEDVYNPKTDNIEVGICDYINDTTPPKPEGDRIIYEAKIAYTKTVIKSGGSAQTFTAKFYDSSGNEVTDVLPTWNIVGDFVDKLQVIEEGTTLTISVDDDDCIDEEFKIELSDPTGVRTASIIVRVESLL